MKIKVKLEKGGYSAQSRPPIPQQTGPPKLNVLLSQKLNLDFLLNKLISIVNFCAFIP
ncbi:MAG: hypothetical protein HGB12_05885 [Bacteroidetes bacterium]|nr:hypothetical protein [Bacteroidota bacterium]